MLLKLLAILFSRPKGPKSRFSTGDEVFFWIVIVLVFAWLN